MTPVELLIASRASTAGSTARPNQSSSQSPTVVDERSASRRASGPRVRALRLSWIIGLGGRLECSLDAHGLKVTAQITFEPAPVRALRSNASAHPAAPVGHCEVLDYSTSDVDQHSVTLRLSNGQRATIELVERGSNSEGSRYLVFTDLPAQLGFRGGTYVLDRIDVDE